jgi:5-methyltetrahydrofolate--homocysteine methyltransferase
MDGAMGTELQRAGLPPGECGELWNLTHPERVQAIHESYLAAGAEVLLTNTFQANPVALAQHGAESHLEAIYVAASALARSAAGDKGSVLVDIGPLPKEIGRDETRIRDWFEQVLRASRDADGLILETYSGWMIGRAVGCLRELRGVIKHCRDMPILLSLAYEPPYGSYYATVDGQEVESVAHRADSIGISALGVNCGRDISMDEVIEIIRRNREHCNLPLFARPNAGTPVREGDRWVYPRTPAMMAERLPALLEAGVSMIGGCCGTTPEYIAAFRPIVDAWNASLLKP